MSSGWSFKYVIIITEQYDGAHNISERHLFFKKFTAAYEQTRGNVHTCKDTIKADFTKQNMDVSSVLFIDSCEWHHQSWFPWASRCSREGTYEKYEAGPCFPLRFPSLYLQTQHMPIFFSVVYWGRGNATSDVAFVNHRLNMWLQYFMPTAAQMQAGSSNRWAFLFQMQFWLIFEDKPTADVPLMNSAEQRLSTAWVMANQMELILCIVSVSFIGSYRHNAIIHSIRNNRIRHFQNQRQLWWPPGV